MVFHNFQNPFLGGGGKLLTTKVMLCSFFFFFWDMKYFNFINMMQKSLHLEPM